MATRDRVAARVSSRMARLGERALRGDRRRDARPLRHAVPSRSRAYARRRETACEFRPQGRWPRARLDHGRLPARGDRAPSATRVGKGRVSVRLSGGVDSAVAAVLIHEAIGDQPDLRLRRPRPVAPWRGGRGRASVSRPLQYPARPCRSEETFPRRAARHRGPRRKAQDHRPAVHLDFRSARPKKSPPMAADCRNFWRKARSIPM